MTVEYEVEGRTLYVVTTFSSGRVVRMKVRTYNTEREAEAMANYNRIRWE